MGCATLKKPQVVACGGHGLRLVVDQHINDAVGVLLRTGPDLLGSEDAQATALDHRRTSHTDVAVAGGDDEVAAAEQGGIAGKAAARGNADDGNLPRQGGVACEGRDVQAGHHRHIGVAGAAAAAFGK